MLSTEGTCWEELRSPRVPGDLEWHRGLMQLDRHFLPPAAPVMFNYLAGEARPQFQRSYGGQQALSGPLKSRLEQLKKPCWWEPTPLVLQHSETARLAIDAFLEQGERGYLSAITEERELPLLSSLDMEYINHQRNQSFPDPSATKDQEADPGNADSGDRSSLNSELTSGTYFPLMSDVHPPELELGWPVAPLRTVSGQTQATVIFQRNKVNSIKDLLRSLISRARTVIAIVMDLFTDMEILCDLLEASSRRHVPVYLILDEEYLKHFVEMCNKMALTQDNFPNMRIRCLSGDTYYSKAGKKFTGQVLEKFILIDCDQVLAGTYSFTWLCSQVHTCLMTHFRGQIVAEFDKEFQYLYAESRAVTSFCLPDPATCHSSQDSSKAANSLLKPTQADDAETSTPSSSLSNVSIRSIKMSPFLKSSSCNAQQEKQDSSSDSGNKKEETSLKPTCPKQQGEPPDSPNSPPNKPSPAVYHKSNLTTARTFLQPEPSPALSSNKPSYEGDSKATSSHCSPLGQEETSQSLSEGATSNGTSVKQKGPSAAPREPTAENDAFCGMEKRQSPRQGKLDLLSPYNQLKRDKKPVVPCYDKLTEDMLTEKNSTYGAEKRLTLGHSKLDLITKYNKLKSKHIHSRFEL
ncbi:protein FAM83C [Patagioenas fasciata monilis]|uniref:Protein FAM83C n=1 Tax=Patagioenas fasciata monilis TaxID=372326 RepID=A0A1V4KDU2_PATFA|nr:protein FAM83C [Patagioenas fasciata monilis]